MAVGIFSLSVRYANCALFFPKDKSIRKFVTGSIVEAAVRNITGASIMEPNGTLVGLYKSPYKCPSTCE